MKTRLRITEPQSDFSNFPFRAGSVPRLSIMAMALETAVAPLAIDDRHRTLEDIVGDPGPVRFSFEDYVKFELKINLDAKRDSASGLTRILGRGVAQRGSDGVNLNYSTDSTPICRFWLQGRCRQGDTCTVGFKLDERSLLFKFRC
jgi:hypothetical protein